MKRLVIATGNSGKLREIRALLAPLGIEVVAQAEYFASSVEETGRSFVENAILKARYASELSGLPALADDSGLEVDALGGAPGVYSARYAGEDSDDAANVQKLLTELKGVPEEKRTARFQCVVALLRHPADAMPIICQGTWKGRIATTPSGSRGFGYDPVFYDCEVGAYAGQMTPEQKNRLSHRGKALKAMGAQLLAGVR